MKRGSFLRNFGSALSSNVVGIALTSLATIITIRTLHIEDWATVAVIISLGPLLSTALSMGSVSYNVRELAVLSEHLRRQRFWRFMRYRIGWSCALGLIGISVSLAYTSAVPLLVALLAGSRFARTGATVLLSAHRKFGSIAFVTVADRLVTLAVVFIAAIHGSTVATLPAAQMLGGVFAVVLALIATRSIGGGVAPARSRPKFDLFYMWRGSGAFGVAGLSGSLQQADVLLVSLVAGPIATGYFAAAARVPGALGVIGSALALVVLPSFSGSSRLQLTKRARRGLALMAVGAFTGTGVLALTATWWTPFLLGEEYLPAILAIQIYLVAVGLNLIYQPAVALLQARGLARRAGRIVALQVGCTLAGQTVLAGIWGASGAAFAYTVVLTGATLYAIRLIKRDLIGRSLDNEVGHS